MKHATARVVALLTLLASSPAWSQAATSDIVTSDTITTTSGNCLAANGNRRSLALDATGAAANVGYCEIAAGATTCTAAIGSAGTTTLAFGARDYWPAGSAPQNGFCFVAASGSQPLTIREGY